LFPTFVTRQYSGYVPTKILEFFEHKLMPDRARSTDKLIYISRKKAGVRRVINEDDVISSLQKSGFKDYCLEDLSFQEQIELFYDARIVVGPHGAGFTNLLFSKNVAVLEMFPYKYVKPSYYYLTRCVGGVYDYTCAQGNSIGRDFNVDINTMKSKIESLLN
jgi:capsular polysaccharide biosynthesis protein